MSRRELNVARFPELAEAGLREEVRSHVKEFEFFWLGGPVSFFLANSACPQRAVKRNPSPFRGEVMKSPTILSSTFMSYKEVTVSPPTVVPGELGLSFEETPRWSYH